MYVETNTYYTNIEIPLVVPRKKRIYERKLYEIDGRMYKSSMRRKQIELKKPGNTFK